ncbi:hypothetical protein D3C84_1086990 [compost metagenome]
MQGVVPGAIELADLFGLWVEGEDGAQVAVVAELPRQGATAGFEGAAQDHIVEAAAVAPNDGIALSGIDGHPVCQLA